MHRTGLLLLDLCLIVFATVSALALRENFEISLGSVQSLLPYLGATVTVAAPVLSALGLNRGIWRLSSMADYVRVVAAALVSVLAAIALGFTLNRLDGVARSLPILQAVLIVCTLVGARVLMRLRNRACYPASVEGLGVRDTVLVVGLDGITELYLGWVAKLARERVKIAGVLACSERYTGQLVHQHPILGTPDQVRSILRDLEVHGVLVHRIVVTVAFDKLSSDAQEALLEVEKSSNIRLELFADRVGFDETDERATAPAREPSKNGKTVFSRSAIDLEALARGPCWRVKRALDVVFALALSVATAPLMLLVALMVVVDVGRPVTFWQQRPGASSRPFKLYKFRTMAAAHDWQGRRIPDENRSSAIGRFLRRTRFDELPQLYNILIGDMSFVGPRPLLPADQPHGDNRRLLVRPGLTGWAQVNGGRDLSVDDKNALDIWYVKNASLWLDAKILLQTASVVLRGERGKAAATRRAVRELQEPGPLLSSELATGQGVFAKCEKRIGTCLSSGIGGTKSGDPIPGPPLPAASSCPLDRGPVSAQLDQPSQEVAFQCAPKLP
jgi:lipopolysaccharide/colanic/teichoic acid biosynthesis glycosyltransferase